MLQTPKSFDFSGDMRGEKPEKREKRKIRKSLSKTCLQHDEEREREREREDDHEVGDIEIYETFLNVIISV